MNNITNITNIIRALVTGLFAAALFLGLALARVALLDDAPSAYHARPTHYGVPSSAHAYHDRYKHVAYGKPLPYVEVQAANANAARTAIHAVHGPVYRVIREGFGRHPLRVFRTEADYRLYQEQNASEHEGNG